jgi:hypothetical protein
VSYQTSRKGGYGKSAERKADGRNTRRQDSCRICAQALAELAEQARRHDEADCLRVRVDAWGQPDHYPYESMGR